METERYYTLFTEKGYVVRDSKDKEHKIVFKGKRSDVNGKEAKKWALEHNKAEVKARLNEIF